MLKSILQSIQPLGSPPNELCYGTPSMRVGKKFLTQLRREDNSLVLPGVPLNERDILIESDPALTIIVTTPLSWRALT